MSHGNIKSRKKRRKKPRKKELDYELIQHPGPPQKSDSWVSRRWNELSRGEVIGLAGLLIAILAAVGTFFVPEVRSALHLEKRPAQDEPSAHGSSHDGDPGQDSPGPTPSEPEKQPELKLIPMPSPPKQDPIQRTKTDSEPRNSVQDAGLEDDRAVAKRAKIAAAAATTDGLPGYLVNEMESDKLLAYRVNPKYPVEAKTQGTSGKVGVVVQIDATGKVQAIDTAYGPPILVDAAKNAVKQWIFKPYLLDGKPIAPWKTVVTFNFPGDAAKDQKK
jgi:TonB family protein